MMVRVAASLIGIGVLVAITSRLSLTVEADQSSLTAAIWKNYRFFTIWTNTLVGLTCAWIALGRQVPQWLTAGLVLAISIVAGVYHAVLAQLVSFDGLALFVDVMVHTIVPVAFALLWLVGLPKDRLGLGSMVYWMIYPVIYCVYVVLRGAVDNIYPYPILDVGELGASAVVVNVGGLIVVFVLGGLAVLAIALGMTRRSD